MVRCGKMPDGDREHFRYAPGDIAELLASHGIATTKPLCRRDLKALSDLNVRYFVDCERSMGERLE